MRHASPAGRSTPGAFFLRGQKRASKRGADVGVLPRLTYQYMCVFRLQQVDGSVGTGEHGAVRAYASRDGYVWWSTLQRLARFLGLNSSTLALAVTIGRVVGDPRAQLHKRLPSEPFYARVHVVPLWEAVACYCTHREHLVYSALYTSRTRL